MTLERVRAIDDQIRDEWGARMRTHASRIAGYDDERIDATRQTAAWFKVGMLLLEAPIELVGTFFPELGLFRWWWSGKENTIAFTPCRMDEAFAEAQRTQIRELLTRQMQLDGVRDAEMLCRVAACHARASAMVGQQEGDRFAWYAVFAASPRPPIAQREQSAPPASSPSPSERVVPDLDLPRREPYLEAARTMPPGAVAPKPSWPPIVEAPPPSAREPARQLLLPVAHAAGALLRRALHTPFRSALLIVNVDKARDKARYFVTLVAATQDGELASVDTTREVIDAVGHLLAEDSKTGNGRWRKLVMRLVSEGEGIAITRCEVSV
jgi:hypothetical protein